MKKIITDISEFKESLFNEDICIVLTEEMLEELNKGFCNFKFLKKSAIINISGEEINYFIYTLTMDDKLIKLEFIEQGNSNLLLVRKSFFLIKNGKQLIHNELSLAAEVSYRKGKISQKLYRQFGKIPEESPIKINFEHNRKIINYKPTNFKISTIVNSKEKVERYIILNNFQYSLTELEKDFSFLSNYTEEELIKGCFSEEERNLLMMYFY